MSSNCAVATCPNYSKKTKESNIMYHGFPRNVEMCKSWVNKCKRGDPFVAGNSRICSVHFNENDYKRDLQAELLGIPAKRRLKDDAVPSLNLPGLVKTNPSSFSTDYIYVNPSPVPVNRQESLSMPFALDRNDRLQARQTRKRGLLHIETISPQKRKLDQGTTTSDLPDSSKEESNTLINKLRAQNEALEAKVFQHAAEMHRVKAEHRKKQRMMISKLNKKHKLREQKIKNKTKEVLKSVFGKVFTKSQIRCLKKGKKYAMWEKIDISRALTLRAISRKSYMYLRKTGIPLPSLSTLRNWTRSFKIQPGLLHNVLELIKGKTEHFTQLQKFCILSFDEISIDGRICYDQEEDRIIGPHSKVQMVMARGLMENWKQPIYYDYDTQMTGAILNDIICKLETSGCIVVGVVSDLGKGNSKVWKSLNVTYLNPCFPNPVVPKRKVWVFADPPHLLKLLRNHFLDQGFIII